MTKVRTVLGALLCFAAGAGFATCVKRDAVAPTRGTPAASIPSTNAPDAGATIARAGLPIAPARSADRGAQRNRSRDEPVVEQPPRVDDDAAHVASGDADLRGRRPKNDVRSSRTKTVRSRFLLAGVPVEGVVIEGARSDAEGRIALTLPRNYRGFLIVQQPDGVQFRVDPPQDDAEAVDLGDVRLSPAATITGVVVDESGKPVAGASVSLLSTDMDCRTMGEAKTDAAGRFAIGRVGPYRYEVYARRDAAKSDRFEEIGARLAAVRGGEDVRLVARPMFPVTFRLLDDATGKPISGTWISCYLRRPGAAHDASLHEHRADVSEVRLLLDAAGAYEAELWLAPAPWTFEMFYRRLDVVDVAADRENVIDVRLRRL